MINPKIDESVKIKDEEGNGYVFWDRHFFKVNLGIVSAVRQKCRFMSENNRETITRGHGKIHLLC